MVFWSNKIWLRDNGRGPLQAAGYDFTGEELYVITFLHVYPAGRLKAQATHFAFEYFFGILRATLKIGDLNFC